MFFVFGHALKTHLSTLGTPLGNENLQFHRIGKLSSSLFVCRSCRSWALPFIIDRCLFVCLSQPMKQWVRTNVPAWKARILSDRPCQPYPNLGIAKIKYLQISLAFFSANSKQLNGTWQKAKSTCWKLVFRNLFFLLVKNANCKWQRGWQVVAVV